MYIIHTHTLYTFQKRHLTSRITFLIPQNDEFELFLVHFSFHLSFSIMCRPSSENFEYRKQQEKGYKHQTAKKSNLSSHDRAVKLILHTETKSELKFEVVFFKDIAFILKFCSQVCMIGK